MAVEKLGKLASNGQGSFVAKQPSVILIVDSSDVSMAHTCVRGPRSVNTRFNSLFSPHPVCTGDVH